MRPTHNALLAIIAILCWLSITPASAQRNPAANTDTAQDLETLCQGMRGPEFTTDQFAFARCVGWLDGFFSGLDVGNNTDDFLKCVPQNLSRAQRTRIFLKYAEDNPELLHMNAGVIFAVALFEAFPCPDKSQ